MQQAKLTVLRLHKPLLVLVTAPGTKAALINLRFLPSVYRKLSFDSWTIKTPSLQAGVSDKL